MNQPDESHPHKPAPRLWSDVAATACPVFGCLGWILLIPCLASYDKSEQLARYFSALFNLLVIGIVGGSSTVLCLFGLYCSRRIETRSGFRASPVGRSSAIIGLVIGVIVFVRHVP